MGARRHAGALLLLGAALGACAGDGEPADEVAAERGLAGDGPRIVDVPTAGATAEEAARHFLTAHANELGVDLEELELVAVRRGRAGSYVRFQRSLGGLPIFDAQVVVVVSADRQRVRALGLGRHRAPVAPIVLADRGQAAAIAAARAWLGAGGGAVVARVARGLEVGADERARLAYRVTIAATAPRATWLLAVDAAGGSILSVRDRLARADGSGLVFDVTPIASTGDTSLVDGDDARTAALDGARVPVVLPRLDGSGLLRGAWADVRGPTQRASSPALAFDYDRQDDRFEEVMAYYHLDRAQERIRALGFIDIAAHPQVAVVNALADDASFYDPLALRIQYGSGGVDDAEDADIVLHEYGHAIQHDQVPDWGGGREEAMGEGFGDYLAASFGEVLPAAAGHAQPFGQFACVGEWDATSYATGTPKCLRRTDGDGHAPEDTTGRSHADGTIWSAGLWRARAAIGADAMDAIVLESHFLLTPDESFTSAAEALMVSEQMLFAGTHEVALRRALYHHGLLRTPRPAAAYSQIVASEEVALASPVGGDGHYPADLDDARTYTRPGSSALRVHFAVLELGAGTCDDQRCDNLYLSDGDGDLFQIFTRAAHGPLTSVQVPGDTIVLRLVSDRAGGAAGYVVDRIEAMGGEVAIDAAVDAALDGPPRIDAFADADTVPPDAAPPPVDDAGGCCDTRGRRSGGSAIGLALVALAIAPRRRRHRR